MSEFVSPPELTSPPRAIVEGGRYNFGSYDAPIPLINQMDAAGPGRLAHVRRSQNTKEWEAFQAGDDTWFMLGAVYNAKRSGLLQLLVVNKAEATITRWEKLVPPWVPQVARGLNGTRSHGRSGPLSITIGNEFERGEVAIDVSHSGTDELAPVEFHGLGDCRPEVAGHLAIVHPFADGRSLYSHKVMMPFEASLRIGGEHVGLVSDEGFLIIDDHHGEYPKPQRYDWLTGVRRGVGGRVEGFNLTANQVVDPEVYNENALWIGNEVHRLPAITIDRPKGPYGEWHAHDRHGQVDVRFTPTVRSSLHIGPPKRRLAEYYAPYGWFEGTMSAADGTTLDVGEFFGVGEQKLIRL